MNGLFYKTTDIANLGVGLVTDPLWDLVASPLHKVGRWTQIALHPVQAIGENIQSSPDPLLKEALSSSVELRKALDDGDEQRTQDLKNSVSQHVSALVEGRGNAIQKSRLSASEQRILNRLASACSWKRDPGSLLDQGIEIIQRHYESHLGYIDSIVDVAVNPNSPAHVRATNTGLEAIDRGLELLTKTMSGPEDIETLTDLRERISTLRAENPHLNIFDILKKVPELSKRFSVNGKSLDISISENRDISAAPELLEIMERHEGVLGRNETVIADEDVDYVQKTSEQKEQFIENTSMFTTVKIVWGKICRKKTDNEFFVDALAEARTISEENKVSLKQAMRDVIYKKIDAANNTSFITKLFAKFVYWIISGTSHFFIESFADSIVKDLQGYIAESEKDNYSPIGSLFIDNLGKYLTSLTAIYNRQAHQYKNPNEKERITGSLPEMVAKELKNPAYMNDHTEAELYSKVTGDIVSRYAPKITLTNTIRKFFISLKEKCNNSIFATVPLDMLSLAGQAAVAIPQWITNGILSFGLRIFIDQTEILPSIVDNTVAAIRDQNGYSHALNKLLYVQLQELYKILQHQKQNEDHIDLSSIEGQDLLSPYSEVHKNRLSTFVENLFHVLDLEDCTTHENLHRLLYSKTLRHRYDELLDAIAIQDVIRASVEVISIAFTSLMRKEQLHKQLYNFMWMANTTFERSEPIDPKEFKTIENGILDTMNSILNISIDKALQEKFDMTGKVQERNIRRSAALVKKEMVTFTSKIDELLEEANQVKNNPYKEKKIVEEMLETAITFEQNLISMKVKWEGNQMLSDSMIRDLNVALQKLTDVYKSLAPLIDRFYKDNDEFLSLGQIKARCDQLLKKEKLTYKECKNARALLERHISSFHTSSDESRRALFISAQENLLKLQQNVFAQERLNLFEDLEDLLRAKSDSLAPISFGKKKPNQVAEKIFQEAILIEDETLQSALVNLAHQILKLKEGETKEFEGKLIRERERVQKILLDQGTQRDQMFKHDLEQLSDTIGKNSATSHGLTQNQEELNKARIEEIREANSTLKGFEKEFTVKPPINIPIAPNALMDFSKALVFSRTQKRLSNLVKFITTPTHYKHGLCIHTLMLPFIGEGVKV